jgi:hypothetical protein
MSSTKHRCGKEEFARRGDTIYDEQIRPQLTANDVGKFVAIDIDSGTYEIAADELKAGDKLLKRLPEAQIWMVRIGYRAVHRFEGRDQRDPPP